MRNYRNAFYELKVSSSESVERWEEVGARDMWFCSFKRWHTFYEHCDAPSLDVGVREALDAFVTQQEALMPHACY